jgi:hypothetical protein
MELGRGRREERILYWWWGIAIGFARTRTIQEETEAHKSYPFSIQQLRNFTVSIV